MAYCNSLLAQDANVQVFAGTYKTFSVATKDNTVHTWYKNGEELGTGDTMEILFAEEGLNEISVQAQSFGCLSPFSYFYIDVIKQEEEEIEMVDDLPEIYPHKFFTPNGDGVNEYWEVDNIEYYPDSEIEIYDRFSKLLVRYKGTERGWDGIYNGHPMQTDDYWYLIKLFKVREWRSGHFTLKR